MGKTAKLTLPLFDEIVIMPDVHEDVYSITARRVVNGLAYHNRKYVTKLEVEHTGLGFLIEDVLNDLDKYIQTKIKTI